MKKLCVARIVIRPFGLRRTPKFRAPMDRPFGAFIEGLMHWGKDWTLMLQSYLILLLE